MPRDEESKYALRAYALASFLFLFVVIGVVGFIAARWLELNYQGTGVVIFLAVFAYLVLRFRRQMKQRRAMRAARGPGGGRGPGERRGQVLPQRARRPADDVPRIRAGAPPPKKPVSRVKRAVRYLLIAALIGALFLPYQYETGGPAEILPLQQQEIYGQTDGVVEEVMYNEGDWVSKGEIIARLSSHLQQKDYLTTEAALQKQRAKQQAGVG